MFEVAHITVSLNNRFHLLSKPYKYWSHFIHNSSNAVDYMYRREPCDKILKGHCAHCDSGKYPAERFLIAVWDALRIHRMHTEVSYIDIGRKCFTDLQQSIRNLQLSSNKQCREQQFEWNIDSQLNICDMFHVNYTAADDKNLVTHLEKMESKVDAGIMNDYTHPSVQHDEYTVYQLVTDDDMKIREKMDKTVYRVVFTKDHAKILSKPEKVIEQKPKRKGGGFEFL